MKLLNQKLWVSKGDGVPFGGGLGGNAPESPLASGEIPLPSKTGKEVRKPIGFRGEADTTASPFLVTKQCYLKNVPVARF